MIRRRKDALRDGPQKVDLVGIEGKARFSNSIVPIDVSSDNEADKYPSLIKYLQATDRVTHLTYAQRKKAKNLYLKNIPVDEIADSVGLKPSIIHRMAVVEGWEEELQRRLFAKFQDIQHLAPNVPERHDRIAGTIESAAEQILQQHMDKEEELSPRDLSTLASTLKTTVDIRRTIRGEKSKTSEKHEHKHIHEVMMPESMDKLAHALSDAVHTPIIPSLVDKPPREEIKIVDVSIGESVGSDSEYE